MHRSQQYQKIIFALTDENLNKLRKLAYEIKPFYLLAASFDLNTKALKEECLKRNLIKITILEGENKRYMDELNKYNAIKEKCKDDPKKVSIQRMAFDEFKEFHKRFMELSFANRLDCLDDKEELNKETQNILQKEWYPKVLDSTKLKLENAKNNNISRTH